MDCTMVSLSASRWPFAQVLNLATNIEYGRQRSPPGMVSKTTMRSIQMAEGNEVSSSSSSSDHWDLRARCGKSLQRTACASASSADVSVETEVVLAASSAPPRVSLTYLEGNSWLWEVAGVTLLVDPILVGPLDFGIPALYAAYKKVLINFTLDDLPELDAILITQNFDDHCHLNTLRPLSQKLPDVPVITTPNAEGSLKGLFSNVTYLAPGETSTVKGRNGVSLTVKATPGDLLGPPWQQRENGYIVRCKDPSVSVYLEPHCKLTPELEQEQADIVITPVVKQELPAFTLVSGQEDAVELARRLKAKFIVPMANGDLDSSGLLTVIVRQSGTVESFQELLAKSLPGVKLLDPIPGKRLQIHY